MNHDNLKTRKAVKKRESLLSDSVNQEVLGLSKTSFNRFFVENLKEHVVLK